jgi:SpoIID/LytB domain protein
MRPKTIYNFFCWMTFFLIMSVGFGQEDNPLLSIRILEKWNPQELEIQCPPNKGVWNEVKLTRGQMTVNGKAQKGASWGEPNSTLKIKVGNLTRIYPGQIDISVVSTHGESNPSTSPGEKEAELFILNRVPLLEYAACVTAFESGHDPSQPEYLKALGILVRCYALSHRKRHLGYDLCDLSHCQVYQGLPPRFGFWEGIIEAGRDFSFPASFDLKSLYFSRCCGGQLESADQIWGGAPSPNRTGPDALNGEPLCKADSFFHWDSSTSAESIETTFKTLARLPADARLQSMAVVEKTAHGRNKTLSALFILADGETKAIRVNAQQFVSEFGKNYGWRVFPSLTFDFKREGATYYFSGRGLGHGVGLCQSGALRLAQMGWDYGKILDFYFPTSGTTSTPKD